MIKPSISTTFPHTEILSVSRAGKSQTNKILESATLVATWLALLPAQTALVGIKKGAAGSSSGLMSTVVICGAF